MPLLITDSDGKVLYKSTSVRRCDIEKLLQNAAEGKTSGIATLGSKNVLVRELLLCGKKSILYFDFDRYADIVGDDGENVKYLIDAAFSKDTKKCEISLPTVARLFAQIYAPPLRDSGVNLLMRGMAIEANVIAAPIHVLLCLTLMVRIFAVKGSTVKVSAIRTGDNIVLFADSDGRMAADAQLLRMMLLESAAAAGFGIDFVERDGHACISLSLTPVDIALYGFKAIDAPQMRKVCEVLLEMFIIGA